MRKMQLQWQVTRERQVYKNRVHFLLESAQKREVYDMQPLLLQTNEKKYVSITIHTKHARKRTWCGAARAARFPIVEIAVLKAISGRMKIQKAQGRRGRIVANCSKLDAMQYID